MIYIIHTNAMIAYKVDCGEPASQFKLENTVSGKFLKIHVASYHGAGAGIQYVGVENEKGIDMGIRGRQNALSGKGKMETIKWWMGTEYLSLSWLVLQFHVFSQGLCPAMYITI